MSRTLEIGFFIVWTAITVLFSYWLGQASYSWMPPQATAEAQQVDSLFSFLVTLGTAIFLGVFGMISHSVLVCRAPQGDFSEGHPSRGSARLEILWTGIPVLLVLWIAVQGYQVYAQLDLKGLSAISHHHATPKTAQLVAAESPLETIEVTAKQWDWSFRYLNQDITSAELHLPVNQPVRLVLKSEDVLHGFYVPAFRIKQDIIPNQEIDFVFSPIREGQYRLNDSQFSGAYFSLMEAGVYVEAPETYQEWLTQTALNPEKSISNLAATEYQNQPNLLGQRWAVRAPSLFDRASVNATKPIAKPDSSTAENS